MKQIIISVTRYMSKVPLNYGPLAFILLTATLLRKRNLILLIDRIPLLNLAVLHCNMRRALVRENPIMQFFQNLL